MFHESGLIWLHIVSDLMITLAYYSIPLALVYFARRRKDLAYNWMFLLFAGFIILCGTTHIFNIVSIWSPLYRLDGLVKLLTGLVSIATAVLLWRLMPHALALPSQMEIVRRKDELEALVQQRTAELTEANQALRDSQEQYKSLAEKAEAASRTKSEFLANMSHELRTPMNAVIGLSHILATSSPLTPKQKEYIHTLQLSADALLATINDLLDISKIEARTVELEHIPFDLAQLIQEIVSMTSVLAKDKGLDVSLDSGCIRDRVFRGDPARLRQIIMNLYGNAVKFTQRGSIHLSVRCESMANENAQWVCIAVKDTGIGIAPEKQKTIFEKFVQGDSSINRKYGGTGLGLAISKTLVEIMGGTLEVESVLGKGSTFTLCLPLEVVQGQAMEGEVGADAVSHPKQKGHPLPILLVEDHAPNILVAGTYLEQYGYAYEVAVNGLEAVEKVKASEYAAVLMDIQMHGMNGLEATRAIREYERRRPEKKRLPIIGMTAHALNGDRERCLEAGMDDYIAKPFDPDKLLQVLRSFENRQ